MRRIACVLLAVVLTTGCGGDPSASNTADVPEREGPGDLLQPLTTDEPVTVSEACREYLDGVDRTRLQTLANRLDTQTVAYEFADLASALGSQARFRRRGAVEITLDAAAQAVRDERADLDAICDG